MDIRQKKFNLFLLLFFVVVSGFISIASYILSEEKSQKLKEEKYELLAKTLHSDVALMIQNKRESTLSIALSSAQNLTLKHALMHNEPSKIDLKEFSAQLRKFTHYKNVWFQIIDVQGKSFYRSWVKQRGDDLSKVRKDVQKMLKNPNVMTTISTGKYDMTFKSMVPIYDNKQFIGIFEIITHFNSISKEISKRNYDIVVLTDKKYKNQLTKAFTKTFIADYYVANLDAKPKFLQYLEEKNVESIIKKASTYFVDEQIQKFIITHKIPDVNKQDMGYVVMFYPLELINMSDVKYTEQSIFFSVMIAIFILFIAGYFFVNRQYNKMLKNKIDEIRAQENKMRSIMNAQTSMIILSNGKEIIEVNDVFFEFFNQYSSIDEFKLHYKCLCDLFVPMDNEQYLIKTEHWLEDVLDVKLNTYKVALYKDEHLHHFILKARRIDILDTSTNNVVLNLIDITELIEKDKILLNQTNMASLGEMIGNIAHQWRQPLSVISTAASGMKVQKEFDVLENKDFIKGMDAIVEATQYLSDTIEDFREFIKGDMKNTYFNIDETVNKSLIILDAKLKNNNIKVIKNIDTKLMINNAANGLVQSLVNIINNAIDALMLKEVEEKYIWIKVFRDEHDVVIEVMDNAGGIPVDIIDKIFEPYFTTKHQSQGTGLGLNMTYRLINEVMFGVIFVQNDHYTYDDKTYEGAKFIIKLTSD